MVQSHLSLSLSLSLIISHEEVGQQSPVAARLKVKERFRLNVWRSARVVKAMAYRKRVSGKSRGPDFPTTLQEGQRTLCLPPSAKLRCVPPDGDCFFHSVKTMAHVDMSIAELREITKCPKGWADEAAMLAVATHEAVQTQFMCYPVDLENLARCGSDGGCAYRSSSASHAAPCELVSQHGRAAL